MSNDDSSEALRSLWQSQGTPLAPMSPEELRRAAKRLTRRVYWRNFREYAAAGVVVFAMVRNLYQFQTILCRTGAALIIAAALVIVYQLHRKGAAAMTEQEWNSKDCAEFYRSELVRQRDLLASVWKWYLLPLVPGMCVLLLGTLQLQLSEPNSRLQLASIGWRYGFIFAGCVALFVVTGKLNHWAARKLQKKIEALDAARAGR